MCLQTWVPSLHAFAIRTSYVVIAVSANEPIATFSVSIASSGPSVVQVAEFDVVDGIVNITSLAQGGVTLSIAGVDEAGNVAREPTTVSVVVVSTLPQVVVVVPPPVVTDHENVTIALASPNSLPGLLSRFVIEISATDGNGSVSALPAVVVTASADGAPTTSGSFLITAPMSAVYALSITAVDVLGGAGGPVLVSTTIDLSPPLSWFDSALPAYGAHMFDVRAIDGAGNVQPGPYSTVSTVVDTVPPLLLLTGSGGLPMAMYTRNQSQLVCVAVQETSPVVVVMRLDGVVVPLTALHCAEIETTAQGGHVVIASAVDAAGNSAADVRAVFVSDFEAPGHVIARRDDGTCATQVGTTCCRSVDAGVFDAACTEVEGSGAVAPCHLQWALQAFVSEAGCTQDASGPADGAWTTSSSATAVVNVTREVRW